MKATTRGIDEMNAGVDNCVEAGYRGAFPVRNILDRVGNKWSVMAVLRLGRRTERFRALLRAVDGISQRMLTVTLRGLERDGLVHRDVFDTLPPTVANSLTPTGLSLLTLITALADWAMQHEAAVKAARAEYDRRNG